MLKQFCSIKKVWLFVYNFVFDVEMEVARNDSLLNRYALVQDTACNKLSIFPTYIIIILIISFLYRDE